LLGLEISLDMMCYSTTIVNISLDKNLKLLKELVVV